jgi:hypothetical protein
MCRRGADAARVGRKNYFGGSGRVRLLFRLTLTGKALRSDSIGAHDNKEGSLIDFKSVSTVDRWIGGSMKGGNVMASVGKVRSFRLEGFGAKLEDERSAGTVHSLPAVLGGLSKIGSS